jgi:hypothetical protein
MLLMSNNRKPPVFWIMFGIFLLLFCISRFLVLDSNLPPWNIAQYIPIDSFFYAKYALNFYQFGLFINPEITLYDDRYYLFSLPVTMLGTVLTYIGTLLFGNTYYGLRSGAFLATMLVFIVVFFIGRRECNAINNNAQQNCIQVWLYVFVGYLLADFSFLIAGKVMEPTSFRTLAMMLVIAYVIWGMGSNLSFQRVILLGVLASISVLFVYPTNFFIVAAMVGYVGVMSISSGWSTVLKRGSAYGLGVVVGIGVFFLFLYILIGGDFFLRLETMYTTYSGRSIIGDAPVQLTVINKINTAIGNFFYFFSTNIFRFNPVLLLGTLWGLPAFFYLMYIKKNPLHVVVGMMFIGLLLQSLFLNDYHYRKLIIVFPLVILMLMSLFFHRKMLQQRFNDLLNRRVWLKYVSWVYGVLSIIFALLILTANLCESCAFLYERQLDRPNEAMMPLFYLNGITLFAFLAWLWFFLKNKKTGVGGIAIFAVLLFAPSMYLNIKYVYSNPQFGMRNALMELSTIIKEKPITGRYSYVARLYSNARPLFDAYLYQYFLREYGHEHLRLAVENGVRYAVDGAADSDKQRLQQAGFEFVRAYGRFGLYESTKTRQNKRR